MRQRRAGTALSTKVGRLLNPVRGRKSESMYVEPLDFEVAYDYSYDGVMRSIEDSYQRLGLPSIDIVYIHDVNRRWHGDAVEQRFKEVMDGGYRALDELRSPGAIKAIGVGVNDNGILVRFAEAGDFDCFMLAGRYTLLEQLPLDELSRSANAGAFRSSRLLPSIPAFWPRAPRAERNTSIRMHLRKSWIAPGASGPSVNVTTFP